MRVFIAAVKSAEQSTLTSYLRRLPYREAIPRFNMDIILVRNGVEAMKKISRERSIGTHIDLIIASEQLPGLSGSKLARYLSSDPGLANIPLVLYDDSVSDDRLDSYVSSGVGAFLLMPLNYERFKSELTALVERKIAREERIRHETFERLYIENEIEQNQNELNAIYIDSLTAINDIRSLAPWSVEGQMAEARIQIGMRSFEQAISILKEIIDADFSKAQAHDLICLCYKKMGKSPEDLSDLERRVEYHPKSSSAIHDLGEACLKAGDYDRAKDLFSRAIKLHKKKTPPRTRARSHIGYGMALMKKAGQSDKQSLRRRAVKAFNKGKDVDPTLLSAYLNLVAALHKLGQPEDAKIVMHELLIIAPTSAEDWLSLFEAYLQQGDDAKARAALDQALHADPDNQTIMMDAATLYMREDDYDSALKLYQMAQVINPSDKRIYNFMGICGRHLKLYALALEAYMAAIGLAPQDSSILYNMGRLLEEMGRTKEAHGVYNKCLFMDNNLTQAKEGLERIEAMENKKV